MDDQSLNIQDFRQRLKSVRETSPHHWEASRKLMAPESLAGTLPVHLQSIQQVGLEPTLQKRLLNAVQLFGQHIKTREVHEALKELTGLPPSKALRALLVWGVLAVDDNDQDAAEDLSTDKLLQCFQESQNPYDVLLQATAPSLLDIGAGDLTFEQELVEQYVSALRTQSKALTLHAFDRLMPGSRVGGVYHKNRAREEYLKGFSSKDLKYQFWGGMDIEQFGQAKGVLSQYTMCTCHAPANPTFAFEPSRVDRKLIHDHLRSTRGESRLSRYEGETVLEVSHQGKELTFPPWKFDIVGPVALLRCMTQRSRAGVLSAIDDEVFWELLSQILAEDQFRPRNKMFTKENIPKIFGAVYKELASLTIGERADLSPYSQFRYVEIRRGAVCPDTPSSFTARQFSHMKEEAPPWWIIFVTNV